MKNAAKGGEEEKLWMGSSFVVLDERAVKEEMALFVDIERYDKEDRG